MFSNNDFSEEPKIHTVGVLPVRQAAEHQDLKPNDPALHAMTDFTRKIAITVVPETQIDARSAALLYGLLIRILRNATVRGKTNRHNRQ